MNDSAIEIEDLRFSYGRNEVLRGVSLQVPRGSIFGFLGRNAAGKTTTIKILLGLLRPDVGTCRINGLDSQKDAMKVRQSVGYMAEDQQMFGWMRVAQIVRWLASFYPTWDLRFVQELMDVLELPPKARIKSLSKGQNSRLALLLALGHRPNVVILDDPTLGLDPIARKDFLRYVIGLLQSNGVTVFFSSHLLYEIEPVADYVAILKDGIIVKAETTDDLRKSVKKLILRRTPQFDATSLSTGRLTAEGVLDVSELGEGMTVTIEDFDDSKRAAIEQESGCSVLQKVDLNLDEIFAAYVIGNRGRRVKV
jgi:ABC-2 type transport system ATP-binding protein